MGVNIIQKRLRIYIIGLVAVSAIIFIYNTIFELTPRLILICPCFSYGLYSWISLGIVFALMILVRLLFEHTAKYRIMYIVTLFILFLVMSLSVTVKFNGVFGLFYFYGGYPRYWVYLPMIAFTGFLIWSLIRFTKNIKKKKLIIVFWLVDILYTLIFFYALLLSFFSSPA